MSSSGQRRLRRSFIAGVIMESEMMWEWAAEQPTEVTTTAIDLEQGQRSAKLGLCAAAYAHRPHGSHEL